MEGKICRNMIVGTIVEFNWYFGEETIFSKNTQSLELLRFGGCPEQIPGYRE